MRNRHVIRPTICLLACAVLACSDIASPSRSTLDGTWVRLDEVPGSSERWDLTVDGSSITGTGTWSGEACCSGTLTVNGTIAGETMHVDVTLVTAGTTRPDVHEHFDGVLATPDMLVGTGAFENGPAAQVRLRRQ
jgi:hypothetical protein